MSVADLMRATWHSAFARESGRLERYALPLIRLLTLLALVAAAVAAQSVAPTAAFDLPVAVAVPAVTSVVGLALFQLQVVRFRALGRPPDLLVGIAFGVTAVADLLNGARLTALGSSIDSSLPQTLTLLSLAGHVVALSFFGIAVVQYGRVSSLARRDGREGLGAVACLLALVAGIALVFEPAGVIAAHESLAVLLLLAVYGFRVLARQQTDAYLALLVFGLSLVSVSKVYGLLFAPEAQALVGIDDLFHLAAYLALLFRSLSLLARDIADRASADERRRLSRDLHDGLAQNLSALYLRLNDAIHVCPDPAPASLLRNLRASRRLAQAALFEARQAITGLRVGSIRWDDCVEALEAFCTEWSQNMELAIHFRVEGALAEISGDLHMELLRILNEAISNAVRHGQATRIDILLAIESRRERLMLRVQDDGHGFASHASSFGTGVGLLSLVERLERRKGALTMQSCPATGTLMQVEMPFRVRGGRAG